MLSHVNRQWHSQSTVQILDIDSVQDGDPVSLLVQEFLVLDQDQIKNTQIVCLEIKIKWQSNTCSLIIGIIPN